MIISQGFQRDGFWRFVSTSKKPPKMKPLVLRIPERHFTTSNSAARPVVTPSRSSKLRPRTIASSGLAVSLLCCLQGFFVETPLKNAGQAANLDITKLGGLKTTVIFLGDVFEGSLRNPVLGSCLCGCRPFDRKRRSLFLGGEASVRMS